METDDLGVQKKITRGVFWIWIALNNLAAETLLAITFLTGPHASMSTFERYWRLALYIFIVSFVFSMITVGFAALFKRPGILLQYSYLKIFLAQFVLFIGSYATFQSVIYLDRAITGQ